MNKYFITGVAGFIGSSLALSLLKSNNIVIGIDSIDNYYPKKIKYERIKEIKKFKKFIFYNSKLTPNIIREIFSKHSDIITIFHFAAQPGVQISEVKSEYSFTNNTVPLISICNNLNFLKKVNSLYLASSSSVYGNKSLTKFSESMNKTPSSLYGFSKLVLEEIAEFQSRRHNIKFICLRFFTVFGPRGRPDMAVFTFINKILNNKKIDLYNNGNNKRDFTYIDDLIKMIIYILKNEKNINKNFMAINLANGNSTSTNQLLNSLSKILQRKIQVNLLPKRTFEMDSTKASISKINKFLPDSYKQTSLKVSLKRTVDWYLKNLKLF